MSNRIMYQMWQSHGYNNVAFSCVTVKWSYICGTLGGQQCWKLAASILILDKSLN